MSRRILGYAVLVYAALTSGVVLQAEYVLGRWSTDWWVLVDVAIWLAYVLGGGGLVLSRTWGRLVVVAAAAAAIAVWLVGIVLLWKADIPLSAGLIQTLAMLIPVSIIVGALSVPAFDVRRDPPSSEQIAKRITSPRIDISYGCFSWIAFSIWIEPLGSLLPIGHDAGQMILMLISIPVVMGTIAAAVTGIVLSVMEWREWPLLVMSLVVISMFVVFLAVDIWSLVDREHGYMWHVGSSAILAFFCVRWFVFVRKRSLHG